MDIEPLFTRLEALAPSFGRASNDIQAMVSRGRAADYKGVMQNCRLVLEALLRALVTDQLKQTPGKAMLDELITKFRQQANAGIIPTNILAHMGTVQAWGNLSAHDHATKLSDAGVTVGKGELMASLNSMVAILDWYAESFGETQGKAKDPSKPAAIAAPSAKKSGGVPMVPLIAGVVVVGGLGLGGYLLTRPTASGKEALPAAAEATSYAPLDALYAGWNEPVPPASCRSLKEVGALAANASNLTALEALPEPRSAEAWYLVARAQNEQKKDASAATAKAIGCANFASAYYLSARVALRDKKWDEALRGYEAALKAAPGFTKARFNLGLLHLQQQRITEGVDELKKVTAADPKHADAHFFLGVAYEGQKHAEEAKAEFCAAEANGRADAKDRCAR